MSKAQRLLYFQLISLFDGAKTEILIDKLTINTAIRLVFKYFKFYMGY